MNDKTRTTREVETREAKEQQDDLRIREQWTPQGKLPIPPYDPDWRFRWVATKVLGESQNMNVSRKFREGWVPCKIEDYPDLVTMVDLDALTSGNIEEGGLVLCKMPESMARERDEYFGQMADQQMTAVEENYFNDNDPRTRKFSDNKSRTTIGSERG